MYILGLKIKNHNKLGDLKLDFTNNDKESKCIVFAGDNGTGKSIIINIINSLMFYSHKSNVLSGEISIKFKFSSYDKKMKFLAESTKNEGTDVTTKMKDIDIFYVHWVDNKMSISNDDNYESFSFNWGLIEFFSVFIETNKVMLPEIVKSPLTYNEYGHPQNINVSNEQLLVSLDFQDYKDSKKYDYNPDSAKIKVFKKAFNDFFESNHLEFEEINNNSEIIFKKCGKIFLVNDFSWGENQIFNIACKMLKNNESTSAVIIDEPENGLHPNWQLKLLEYCKSLSINKQLIISTHSPFIIGSLSMNDKLVILRRDESGNIVQDKNDRYYSIGEVLEVTKLMDLSTYEGKIIILVSGKTDEMYLSQTIELWKNQENCEILKEIKIIYPFGSEKGGRGGDYQLLNLNKTYSCYPNMQVHFIYDWDIELVIKKELYKENWLKNYIIMKLPEEIQKSIFYKNQSKLELKGIENFLEIKEELLNKYSKPFKHNDTGIPFKKIDTEQKINLAKEIIKTEKNKLFFKELKEILVSHFAPKIKK